METRVSTAIEHNDWLLATHNFQSNQPSWLPEKFKNMFQDLQNSVEECLELLSPNGKPSTVNVSTGWAKTPGGFLKRSGTRLVGGELTISLAAYPTMELVEFRISKPYTLPVLALIYSLACDSQVLINEILCTEPVTAPFLWGNLVLWEPVTAPYLHRKIRLLSEHIFGMSAMLAGMSPEQRLAARSDRLASAQSQAFPPSDQPPPPPPPLVLGKNCRMNLSHEVLPPAIFSPTLPHDRVALTASFNTSGLAITIRTLDAVDGWAVGLMKRLGIVRKKEPVVKGTGSPEVGLQVRYGDRLYWVTDRLSIGTWDPELNILSETVDAMARTIRIVLDKMDTVTQIKSEVR